MNTAYSYDNIVLTPKYSEIKSRSKLDTSVEFLGKKFKSVAIPANMKCTIDFKKAKELSEAGYFYVLHRFYDYNYIYDWVRDNQDLKTISISVGVNGKDWELVNDLFANKLRVDYITIDVAHGHHILVKDMIKHIKNHCFKNSAKIIAGNIGTIHAARDLSSWGADAVKVGLSMGKSCTTYNCTGVGTPMFSTVANLSYLNVPVIADGQIREVGDVCKALVAGADMVMIGSEFAKCANSPAKTVGKKKEFYGSASSTNKGHNGYVEGKVVYLDMREESYKQYFDRINQGIQSCMSYAGIEDITKLYLMEYSVYK
jgi:GMP reductase